MKFNHIGIPTTARFEGEIDIPRLQVTGSDHQSNRFGIQWMRCWHPMSMNPRQESRRACDCTAAPGSDSPAVW